MIAYKAIFILALPLFSFTTKAQISGSTIHNKTVWNLKSSVKYDVFCLLNIMTADPFYLRYYQSTYTALEPKLTPKVKESLKRLRKFKDEKGLIISASLSTWFNKLPDSSLLEIVNALRNKVKVKQLISNEYNNYLFSKMQKDVVNIIQFLIDIKYEEYYKSTIQPAITYRIDSMNILLKDYNIVPQIEKIAGVPLKSDTVIFYMVKYAKPHGINISSNTFISDISYDLNTSLRVAIHEMLHPFFNDDSFHIKEQVSTLQKDSFIYNAFINHDKSFGYNDFHGYIYESIVRVLEQTVSEKFNLISDRVAHWKTEDKGMHVFAAILYSKMLSKSFPANYRGDFKQFLLESINDVHKEGGEIIYNKLYN